MADITSVALEVGSPYVDGVGDTRVDLTIDFDVTWDQSDQVTGQVYSATWELWEKDTFDQEDGTDDFVVKQSPSRILEYASDGSANQSFTINVIRVLWSKLNKDTAGYDEIYAIVTLTPKEPLATTGVSPHLNLIVG
jgi:hypothetical protein